MLFNSLQYAWFLPTVFVVSWALVRLRLLRLIVLLCASYFFYASWNVYYLPLIFASSSVDYWLGLKIAATDSPRRKKQWLTGTVVTNLGFLGLFKYWNFGADSVQMALAALGCHVQPTHLRLALPIGISFFTFESMSYVIDVYRGTTKPCTSYLKYLLFVAFFPHLVAGPIIRPRDLIGQFEQPPSITSDQISRGTWLIAAGLFKKMAIGDYLSTNLVDRVFAQPASFSAIEVLVAVYGYAIQIYCDFSGYTDIAIGSAALLGVKFPLNFNSPYQATNLQDFWNRWHISLSSWLRDYLFLPLGGTLGSWGRTVRNFVITMLLGGLWHGAAWKFVFWGLLHGVGLAATFSWWQLGELRGVRRRRRPKLWRRVMGTVLTFHFVCFGWVFFRAESFAMAWAMLRRLGSLTSFHPNLSAGVLAALGVGFVTHYLPDKLLNKGQEHFAALPAWAQGACLFAFAWVLQRVATAQAQPFIYFQF